MIDHDRLKWGRATYPRVHCDHHPDKREPGYVACLCIARGERVHVHIKPTPTTAGQLLCERDDRHSPIELTIACVSCLKEHGVLDEQGNVPGVEEWKEPVQ